MRVRDLKATLVNLRRQKVDSEDRSIQSHDFSERSKHSVSPIIKPVGDSCNLRCRYCFYNNVDQSMGAIMDWQLLEKFIAEYLTIFSGDINFIWHGGEPLLAGMDFFDQAVKLQKKYSREGDRFRNLIQTNGTLINDEWAVFFKDNQFKVGISLDGGSTSHNLFRKSRFGSGSFDKVINGINKLREHGINPGFIRTVTRSNLRRIEEDFDFFTDFLKSNHWGLNPFLSSSTPVDTMISESLSPKDLTEFLIECIDLWLRKDDPALQIREIENFFAGIMGKRANNCSFNGTCGEFICIDSDGKIYPCDRSSHVDDLMFGDLHKESLQEILDSEIRKNYITRLNSIHQDCENCEWYHACHNGCTMMRNGGIDGKYYYCETRKAVFSYLSGKVVSHYMSHSESI